MPLYAIILIFIAAVWMFVLALYRPPMAVALFAALLPAYLVRFSVELPLGLPTIPTTLLEMLFFGLLAAWFVNGGWRPVAWRPLKRWALPMTLLLVGATIGTLVSPDLRAALGVWRAYFIEPMLFFVIAADALHTENDRRLVLFGLTATVIVVGLIAFYQKFTGWGIPNPYWADALTRRVTAFYGYPNAIALTVAPTVVLLAAGAYEMIRKGSTLEKGASLLLAMAVLLGIAATAFAVSKGGLMAITVGLIVLGLMRRPTRAATLIAIIAGCAVILFWSPALERASSLVGLRDPSGSVRASIWSETSAMLADHPVFGAGLSGYQQVFVPYHRADYIEIFMYPHNIVLNFWTETGLIGLVGFFWLLGAAGWMAWRAARSKRGGWWPTAIVATMTVIVVHGLVDVPYFKNDLAMAFWLLLALFESALIDAEMGANPLKAMGERIKRLFRRRSSPSVGGQ
ncbi:MAG: O-antigen ligase family protein [Patescibacteria group bacterium]|nr:O-antigen ligase family protein [Patescibacteria group bacterium]